MALRHEAVESRLRGIDLEITAMRKGVDGLDESVKKNSVELANIGQHQEVLEKKLRTILVGLMVALGLSAIAIVVNLV